MTCANPQPVTLAIEDAISVSGLLQGHRRDAPATCWRKVPELG